MFGIQIWGTYVWQLALAFLVGIFDEAIVAYFYIIIGQNKRIQSFILASFITFFNLWVYVMIMRVVAIENQLDLIISYALGTGLGAIATIMMQSKQQRRRLRKAIRRTFRLRRRATVAGREVPGFTGTFAESLRLEYSRGKVDVIEAEQKPVQTKQNNLRLIVFNEAQDVKHAA